MEALFCQWLHQATTTTRKAYRDLSIGQFEQLKFKLNSEKELTVSGRDALRLDYEGTVPQGGKEYHFLALAVIDKERVVLVTCTALPENFAAVEPEFQACIASLKFP